MLRALRAVLLRAVLQACVRWVVMVPVLRVLVYHPVLETRPLARAKQACPGQKTYVETKGYAGQILRTST